MSANVYSVTKLVGTSEKSIEDAIDNAIATASKTIKNLDWFEVSEIRGSLGEGSVSQFQVTMKVGFRVD